MSLTAAPHIREVDHRSSEFQAALNKAGAILAGTGLNVYSRHHHYKMEDTEVLFEKMVAPDEMTLYPLLEGEAAKKGLPSSWGFEPNGAVVALRYAETRLHDRSGIDVTSKQFLVKLDEIGRAFAKEDIHKTLELNIAEHLFPCRDKKLRLETTNESDRTQTVTQVSLPSGKTRDQWGTPACWTFDRKGEPAIAGICRVDNGDH